MNTRYECELPIRVRQEIFRPKREKPRAYSVLKFTAYLLCITVALIAALMVRPSSFYQRETASKNRETIRRAIAAAGVSPAPTPIVITQPLPFPQTFSDYSNPAPKAELIKLPAWRIGETRAVQMRYGEIVNATLQGQVDSYNQLPRHGQLGDAWIVAGTPWIWTHPSGSAFTTWIDP
jgi:hypothetical protein